jgi:hypothetical protein
MTEKAIAGLCFVVGLFVIAAGIWWDYGTTAGLIAVGLVFILLAVLHGMSSEE